MANTILRFFGWPGGDGKILSLESVGGSGTPEPTGYDISAISARVYEVTIAEALVGDFEFVADGGGIAVGVATLIDAATTIDLASSCSGPSSETVDEIKGIVKAIKTDTAK